MVLDQHTKILKIFLILVVVMLFAGCQEEYTEINEPDKDAAFTAGDTIADLILKVTLKDGSFDNIVDNCSEISIKFPYSVQIRNEIVTLKSPDDVENLKEKYFQSRNSISIKYPITIIKSDYSESLLSNPGDLQKIQVQYNTGKKDDDIECIDFVYPIEMNLYNTEYQKPDFVRAGNDKDMHSILKNMDDLIVEIAYPIVVKKSDGTSVNINNNKELKKEIVNIMDSCDEDDETEIEDEKDPGAG